MPTGCVEGGPAVRWKDNRLVSGHSWARLATPDVSVGALDVEIRAGVHTGEVEIRGPDVGGIGVHIAARIAALATTGEILVSRTVKDLVTGSGLVLDNRGSHELKGVPDTSQLYAVVGS